MNPSPAGIEPALLAKEQALARILAAGGPTLLAYSGGVDSAYLAVIAAESVKDRFCAVLAESPALPAIEREEAEAFASARGIPLRVIATRELEREPYRRNGPDRCFHCRSELFALMAALAAREGFTTLIYGANRSDRGDWRPGSEAAGRFAVRAPLDEAGLEKEEIRRLARRRNLSVWDKPALACLASRIPHFSEVTREKLAQIERAEALLRELGFRDYRIRHHGQIARIEVGEGEWRRFADPRLRERIDGGLRALGFAMIALDLQGFHSGRLSRISREGGLTEGGTMP